ncbi:MAG TPA: metal-sensitive transcriptional regulator [Thermoanaerobaculia bacterium]|nr:metal-sensitive transcriptional regulator [Thermoanaerobaculia bacterium]
MTKQASPRLMTIQETRKEELFRRLGRIGGQIEGLRRMIEDGRYCIEILNQAASAQEALRGFSRAVMRNYLESCATSALRTADPAEADRIYDEILDQLYKHAR